MNLKLWEITDQLEQLLLEGTDEETGEIDPACWAQLEALEIAKDQKACDVACYIKSVEADAEALDKFIKSFTERKAALMRRAKSLRQYLAEHCAGEKFKDTRVSIYWAKSHAVVVSDLSSVPSIFVRPITEESVMRSKVKEAIAKGQEVPGCTVQENKNLVIR